MDIQVSVVPPENVPTGDDEKAIKENTSMNSPKGRRNHANRQIHWVFVVLIWFFFIVFMICALIRVWHVLSPESLQWLSKDQIEILDKAIKYVLSGGIGASMGKHYTKVSEDTY